MLGVSSQEFWRENGGGGGGGWGTNTLVVLLVLFICQLAAKTRLWLWFRLLLFPNPNIPFRSISPDLKNSPPFPTINSQFRISEITSDLDLKNLIDNLDENSHKHPKWDSVIDKRKSLIAYSAKCCKPKDGPLKYLSVTIFDNCSAESLRDFYMDNNYRKNWDKTLIELEQLQVDESNGTEIGLIIKKFPLLTAREYLLAWRVWESKDGTLYCFSKVPVELDTITNISGLAFPETSTTNSSVCQIACEGSERKFSRRPSNKLTANGLILLGGAICMSRGQLGCKDCHRICPD